MKENVLRIMKYVGIILIVLSIIEVSAVIVLWSMLFLLLCQLISNIHKWKTGKY